MNSTTLTELISIPLFTGLIGFLTNWTGVLMLVRPLRFCGVPIPGLQSLVPALPRRVRALPLLRPAGALGWQGLVPTHANALARIAVDQSMGTAEILVDFNRELDLESTAIELTEVGQPEIRALVEQIMQRENPQLWRDLSPTSREAVHARIRQQLPRLVSRITEELEADVEGLIAPRSMIVSYFSVHPEALNELFMVAGRKELTVIQNFGFYFGFPMGFVLFGLLRLYSSWWIVPLGGLLIGGAAGYLGRAMLFGPVASTRWVPWRQGLLVKHEAEIIARYARTVADEVLTPHAVSVQLLTGPRLEPTRLLLEQILRPVVDSALAPARAAARVSIGTKEYDQIWAEALTAAAPVAPNPHRDVGEAQTGRHQSARICAYLSLRLHQLSPGDFVRLLRTAVAQDEWLLAVQGGAIGLLAGLLHLAVFNI